MLTIWNATHARHHGRGEFTDGRFMPCFEVPRRVELVLEAVRKAKLGPVEQAVDHGLQPIECIHTPGLVRFIAQAYDAWRALGRTDDALPMTWPIRRLRDKEPRDIDGRLGFWCFDAATPIGPGTYEAACGSAQVAVTAAHRVVAGARAAFALCRPPGHHAAADVFGGYCFFNNAAIAAQTVLDAGAARVAILDLDYHHGNGTQAIFEDRADVLFVSLHADPAEEYPFFLGYADERGRGAGEGFNLNLPLPLGTDAERYADALARGLARIADFGPDLLLVSLGVDTFAGDPIGRFELQTADFPRLGKRIARLGRPTLFLLEGGYAVEESGTKVLGVLTGFIEAQP